MKYFPWLVAMVLLVAYGCERQESGRQAERIAQLEKQKAQVDTVYKTQTKTLIKVRRVTDSILTTDTLYRVDTVRQMIATERKACDAVIQTCEQRVAVRDSLLALERKRRPGRLSCVVGAAATPKGFGPGAACGIRL